MILKLVMTVYILHVKSNLMCQEHIDKKFNYYLKV